MPIERRRTRRIPCLIPARSPQGRAVIEDMSPFGARLRSGTPARPGQKLPLELMDPTGRTIRLVATVRRVRDTARGYDIGCSFEADAASCTGAWRITRRLAAGGAEFVRPPTLHETPTARFHWRDHFGLSTLLLAAVGLTVLVLGGIVAVGCLAIS